MEISSSQIKEGRVSNPSNRILQNSKEKKEFTQNKTRNREAKRGFKSTRGIAFRILCHESKVGSVIGKSGSVVKQLKQNTGAKIRLEDPVPACDERVVLVVGNERPKKKITIEGSSDVYEVSSAQEALIRVFEKVMESNDISKSKNSVSCRLIIQASNVGFIRGKEGKVIERICQESGVKARILTADEMPACVSTPDELIQIMGDALSVKKALLAVSCCLQESCMLLHSKIPDVQREIISVRTLMPSTSASGHGTDSVVINKICPLSKRKPRQEVSFRLCCSNNRIGGIIGKGGSIVNALEKNTGASVKVGPTVTGSEERVITVSALESPDLNHSPTLQAVDRVFARLVEVGIEKGLDSSSDKVPQTSARLLVPSNQIGCLVRKGGSTIEEMGRAFGTKIQILSSSHVPKCAVEKEKVIQINGDYQKVRDALFHVTNILRDNMFPSKRINETRGKSTGKVASQRKFREPLSSGLGNMHSDNCISLTQSMNCLEPSNDSDHPSRFQSSQTVVDDGNLRVDNTDAGRGSTASEHRIEFGSGNTSAIVTRTTLEILVSSLVLGSIYGESGRNLTQIKQISGAEVTICDAGFGTKVIISGTPDQTQAAQSLLQTFIQSTPKTDQFNSS